MITKETTDIAPLGIDEPSKLWVTGVILIDTTTSWRCKVHLSEESALFARVKMLSTGLYRHMADAPFSLSFDQAIAMARDFGIMVMQVVDFGRVIEEYPV